MGHKSGIGSSCCKPSSSSSSRECGDRVPISVTNQTETEERPDHKTQKADTFLNSLERKKIIKYGRSRAAVLTRRQRERQAQESQTTNRLYKDGQNDDQADSVTLESIDSMRRSVAIQYFGVIPVAISTHGAIGQGLSDLLKEFRRRDVTATSEVESFSGDTSSEDSTVSDKSLFQTSFWRIA
ncbi:hypothetical protein ADUPG1_010358, partial [Aduncisulcus paluster]